MKKLLIIFLSVYAFASSMEEASLLSKNPATEEKAAEIYLEYVLQGNPTAMIELGKLFIYGKGMKNDCKKGIIYLFNSVSGENKDYKGYLELSNLFKRGICVNKDEQKEIKYRKIYYEKIKGLRN